MFKVNELVHGFLVKEIRELPESRMIIMEHTRSRTPLIWLDNGEDNKLFSIAFKTTPADDTGVFHILEHSVLNGSKKYPVREPFVELLKSSMNTFLNAMTFPDKTVYPVSSRNEKDFENLMSVYLDAVFEPAIYYRPNIFYQEGWHHELRNRDEDPVYKGVVFNEMKGAFSSVDTILDTEMTRLLFKDSCYGKVSGGDPEHIPDLSYQQFINTHREYYHPSNARIYLDGNMDIDRALKMIDEGYLSKYDYNGSDHQIIYQENHGSLFAEKLYPVSAEDELNEAGMLSIGKVLCRFDDKKAVYAAEILADYLFGSNDAPLKKALLRSGLMKDADCIVNDGIYQPYISTAFRNIDVKDADEIIKLYRDSLVAVKKEGINHEELLAAMNQFEFKLREKSEPTALYNNINILASWLYDGDPELYLNVGEIFDELRRSVKESYFEDLFDAIFLDSDGEAVVKLVPSYEEEENIRNREVSRIRKEKAEWSDEELDDVIRLTEQLDIWQKTPDTKEDLATLPTLDLSEVGREPVKFDYELMERDGVPVIYHPHALSGITYLTLYFSMNDLEEKELYPLGIVGELLANIPTAGYSVAQIQQLIRRDLGGLGFAAAAFADPKKKDAAELRFCVNISVLDEKTEEAMSLVNEILHNTRWSEKSEIREIFKQNLEYYKQAIIQSGHSFALKRAIRNFSVEAAVKEKLDGFSNYLWLKDVLSDDAKFDEAVSSLESVLKRVVVKERCTVSICSEDKSNIETVTAALVSGACDDCDSSLVQAPFTLELNNETVKEAIEIPSGVSYAVKAVCVPDVYRGYYKVLSKIATFSYLWNEVRVKGGAYGTGMNVGDSDILAYYSYRDPSPVNSLNVYDSTSDFIKAFEASDEGVEKYIISTIADFEPLVSVRREAGLADSEIFRGMTYERRLKEREELLNTTKEDILACIDLLDRCADEGNIVIAGNSDAILKAGIKNIRSI